MKMFSKTLTVIGLAAAFVSAQNMNDAVSKLGEAAGKAYLAPVISGFGSNLNAGWYHKAPAPKKFGFHVEAGAVFMGTLLTGGSKTLDVIGGMKLDTSISRPIVDNIGGAPQSVKDSLMLRLSEQDVPVRFVGPTIIGEKSQNIQIIFEGRDFATGIPAGQPNDTVSIPTDTVEIAGTGGVLEQFSDIPLPMFAPQITLGTIYGTNATFRWLPEYTPNDKIGTIKFFGFGIQHNPGVWLGSSLPVDLSVGYFTQTLEIGTLFKASSHAVGLNVSKTLGWRFLNLTPYGGVQFEKSSFDVDYEIDVRGVQYPVDFVVAGENKYRATAGLSIRLLAINLNADYNIGNYNSFSAGVMIGI